MAATHQLRELLSRQLEWEDAHVGYARAVEGVPVELRGALAPGFSHTVWEFVEHLRLAQADILDFCVNRAYVEVSWPDDYWPNEPSPAGDAVWEMSIADFQSDVRALRRLALDEKIDLFAAIPHGSGQTYLRELMLVLDHNAYHLGQLVAARRALGCWE